MSIDYIWWCKWQTPLNEKTYIKVKDLQGQYEYMYISCNRLLGFWLLLVANLKVPFFVWAFNNIGLGRLVGGYKHTYIDNV